MHVKNLVFNYGRHVMFDGWSKSFPRGLTLVEGGNGAGKSTLLKLLAGVLPPSSGQIHIGDAEVSAHPIEYRRHVFWCGPGPVPYEHLTVDEYWGFMRRLYPLNVEKLSRHIAAFGLEGYRHASLYSLSTGTQRKVWIACALAVETEVTLLDEPLNALDAASLAHVKGVLGEQSRKRDCVWILCSHTDVRDCAELADVTTLKVAHMHGNPSM